MPARISSRETKTEHPFSVMAGHSRPKDGVASARLCPAIHVFFVTPTKTWMPGTSSAKTRFALLPGHDDFMDVLPIARIGNHPACHQPVPDEQHHQRADRRGDEAGALIRTVVTDGLADEGREKRAGDAEHGGQDESARVVRARRKQSRDNSRDEADDDNPENAAHGCRPSSDG